MVHNQLDARIPSIPPEIFQSIFNYVLVDEVYSKQVLHKDLSYRMIGLRIVVEFTKNIRSVCSYWWHIAHSLLFTRKHLRDGLIIGLPRLLTAEELQVFPGLRDCAVELCHSYSVLDAYSILQELTGFSSSLEYICSVAWMYPLGRFATHVLNSGLIGYGQYRTQIALAFVDECDGAGLKIVNRDEEHADQPRNNIPNNTGLDDPFLAALASSAENFLYKESLALWYHNAQIVRQILSKFSCLEHLALPALLHVPLLANKDYFFPQCEDDSLFAPVSQAPPRMLRRLGITYEERGRSYSDIMSQVKTVSLDMCRYFPSFILFTSGIELIGQRSQAHDFVTGHLWFSWSNMPVRQRLEHQVALAVNNISEEDKRKVTLFDVDDLAKAPMAG